ncbi:hypothetical protein PMAYCL1PPCAC_20396, partial [Pristionchus mayeri]
QHNINWNKVRKLNPNHEIHFFFDYHIIFMQPAVHLIVLNIMRNLQRVVKRLFFRAKWRRNRNLILLFEIVHGLIFKR